MGVERNVFLTKAIGGKQKYFCDIEGDLCLIDSCVMEPAYDGDYADCTLGSKDGTPKDCKHWKLHFTGGLLDFSKWENFGLLWEWATQQKWWQTFRNDHLIGAQTLTGSATLNDELIHPNRFADTMWEFLTHE